MKRSRGRVLVVEDECDLRQLLLQGLAREGFAAAGAGSGPEALAIVEQELPDLIILDLVLPGMDGFETLRRIRTRRREPRVVVLTGYGTAERARRALALGASELLAKPFELQRLLQIVAEQVSGAARSMRRAGIRRSH